MPQAGPHLPLHRDSRGGKRRPGHMDSPRPGFPSAVPWIKSTGGSAFNLRGKPRGPRQMPGNPTMTARASPSRKPVCSAIMVPWLNPTSATALKAAARSARLGLEKAFSTGSALRTPSSHSRSLRDVSANHCRPPKYPPGISSGAGETKAASGKIRAHSRPKEIRSLPSAP